MTLLDSVKLSRGTTTNISPTSVDPNQPSLLQKVQVARKEIQPIKIEPVKIEKTPLQKVQSVLSTTAKNVGSFVGNLLQKSTARKQVEEKLKQPTPTFTPTAEIKPTEIIKPSAKPISATLTPETRLKVEKKIEPVIEKAKNIKEKGKVALVEIAKRTSGTGIAATIKSASPEVTFKQAYDVMRKSQQEKDNTLSEQFFTSLKDTAPQTAIGIALGFVPVVGPGLSTSYWAAVSAGSEIEEKGYATPTNVAIDVIGDRVLGGMLEKLFKTPAKSLLKIVKKAFVVEGGTEPAQDLLKFANDYRLAKTKEEKQSIMDKAKNYITSGQILIAAGVGGITGAGIATVAGGVNKAVNQEVFSPQDVQDSLSNSTLDTTEEKDKVEALIKEAQDKNTQIIVNNNGVGDVIVTTPEGDKVGLSLKEVTKPTQVGKEEMVTVYRTANQVESGNQVFDNKEGALKFATPTEPVIEFQIPKSQLEESPMQVKKDAGIFTYIGKETVKPITTKEIPTAKIPEKELEIKKQVVEKEPIKTGDVSPLSPESVSKVQNSLENTVNNLVPKDTNITLSVRGQLIPYKKIGNDWVEGLSNTKITNKNVINQLETSLLKEETPYQSIKELFDNGEMWDSGNLSKIQEQTLNILKEKGLVIKEKGIPGVNDTFNGVADIWKPVSPLSPESVSPIKTEGEKKGLTIKEAEQVKEEAVGKAEVATEQRATVNENNIALAKRIVNSRAYQENDIEFVRKKLNIEQNQRIDDIVEDGRNANGGEMTETEAIEYVAGLPTKAETKVKLPEEYKTFVKKRKKAQLSQDNKILKSRVFERLKAENESLTGDVEISAINLDKDAERAVRLIAKDKQKAFNIAMGFEVSDKVTSTSVNIAMAEKALQDGNTELYERLVKNRSLAQTRRGQEIVAEKGSITDNSTSKYVKELISARLDALGKKYLGDLENEITKRSNKDKAIKLIDNKVSALETKIKNKKLGVKDALLLLDKLKCI